MEHQGIADFRKYRLWEQKEHIFISWLRGRDSAIRLGADPNVGTEEVDRIFRQLKSVPLRQSLKDLVHRLDGYSLREVRNEEHAGDFTEEKRN